MPIKRDYNPSIPVLMKLLGSGTLTIRQVAEILDCSQKTVQNFKAQYGIESVYKGTGSNRREASEANKKRNEMLLNLANQVVHEGAVIKELAEANFIPLKTLYRWVNRIKVEADSQT